MADIRKQSEKSTRQKIIQLPRRLKPPVRVRITHDAANEPVKEYTLGVPFSIGYGEGCEIKLPKGRGPERLFEFSPSNHSSHISLPLKDVLENGDFEIYINDERFEGNNLSIKPGSTVRILDKEDDQEVELFINSADGWKSHLMSLYTISALLFLTVLTIGLLMYRSYQKTDERLVQTETRLTLTEAELSDWNSVLKQTIDQFEQQQLKLEHSLVEISNIQAQVVADLQSEFSSKLEQIKTNAHESLSRIAEEDQSARELLRVETGKKISELESDMSSRFINTLEQFKAAQEDLFILNTARIETLEQESSLFKEILLDAQKSVVFIRTTYMVKATSNGQKREVEYFGTGFTIDPSGLSIAPQHVLKPWMYDDNMLALTTLGQVEVLVDTVNYSVWTSEEQVLKAGNGGLNKEYLTDTAFRSGNRERGFVLLFTAEPETGMQMLNTPFGAIPVEKPLVGHTDIGVFQLIDFDRVFAHLIIDNGSEHVEAMDEVMTVGYPLSRLHDGKSLPQGVKGFVRRQTRDFLELDTALHPGSSGAPVLSRNSIVIGMAVALVNSDSYGIAVTASYLNHAIASARLTVRTLARTFMESNCYSGAIHDQIDELLWSAMHGDCQ